MDSGNFRCTWVWLISHGWTEVAGRCLRYICVFCAVLVGSVQLNTVFWIHLVFSWINSFIFKHEICFMLHVSPNISIALEQILIFKTSINSKTDCIIVKWHHFGLSGLGLVLTTIYYFCSEASEDIDTSDWSDCKTWKRNLLEVWNLWRHTRKMD